MSLINITLYNSCDILPNKNMYVEDLENYLSTLTKESFYINVPKLTMSLDIKIKREYNSQVISKYNYARIFVENTNQDVIQTYYYFITSFDYHINSMTMSLHLELDTITSFWNKLIPNLSRLTTISRQHKDRWFKIDSSHIRPIVNGYDEGITPVKYLAIKTPLTNANESPSKWYLVYATSHVVLEQDRPFEALLVPSETFYATGPSQSTLYDGDDCISMRDIDVSDSKIMKIVQCPYCPAKNTYIPDYEGEHAMIVENANGFYWDNYNGKHCIKMTLFDSRMAQYSPKLITNHNIALALSIPSSHQIGYNSIYETKLYNSAFTTRKIVYENNVYNIDFERIDFDDDEEIYGQLGYKVEYIQSREVSGNFIYKVSINGCNGVNKHLSDFEQYTYCETHNEKALFNSEYLNYMRVGYNYDIKQKNRQAVISSIGAGLSVVGAVASFASGPMGAVAGISLATNAISTTVNLISNLSKSEDAIRQKQEQLASQAGSVANNDLIDLKAYSSKNLLYYIQYNMTEEMKQALTTLFHLTGYACSASGIPNFNSRWWFNYVKFNPVFNSMSQIDNAGITNEFIDDFVNRCNIGVTIYHKRDGLYDFAQLYENMEVNLYE